MAESTLSRRISEFLGVALFALALIWLIALVTYEPTDPVWFFTTDALHPPANFVGRVGAFLSELSFQLLGYAEYLNRTGSIIVLFTLMVLAVILSTQFSFGRMFANASQGSRDLSARGVGFIRAWLEDRRKQKARREVVAKHARMAEAAQIKES